MNRAPNAPVGADRHGARQCRRHVAIFRPRALRSFSVARIEPISALCTKLTPSRIGYAQMVNGIPEGDRATVPPSLPFDHDEIR